MPALAREVLRCLLPECVCNVAGADLEFGLHASCSRRCRFDVVNGFDAVAVSGRSDRLERKPTRIVSRYSREADATTRRTWRVISPVRLQRGQLLAVFVLVLIFSD